MGAAKLPEPANDTFVLPPGLPKVIRCFDLELRPVPTQSPNTVVYKNDEFHRSGPQIVYRAQQGEPWTGLVFVGGVRIPVHGDNAAYVAEKLQDVARRELKWQQHLWTWGAANS